MKKELLVAVFAMFIATSALAQGPAGSFALKPMAGGTLTSLNGEDSHGSEMRLGYVAGLEASYQASPHFAVSIGALYTRQGCNIGYSNTLGNDMSLYLDYLNFPILGNYYIVPGLAVKAGLQLGYRVNSKVSVSYSYNYQSDGYKFGTETRTSNAEIDINTNGMFNKFDLSIPIGLSYEFSGVVIDARYNWGLLNVPKRSGTFMGNEFRDEENHMHNSVFMLTVGYKIQL